MLSCEMWLVPHAQWETSNAARNWRNHWTTADLFRCHPPSPINFTPWPQTHREGERETGGERERGRGRETDTERGGEREGGREREGDRDKERETESLKPLTKMHFVIKMWPFFFMHNKYKGFEQLCERGLFCIKMCFSLAYIWDLWTLTL